MLRHIHSSARRGTVAWALLLLAAALPAFGYVFTGQWWPVGTTINMQLSLGPTSVTLQDGSGTWNNSAAAALDSWNQHLQGVRFSATQTSGTTGSGGDGVNSAFFSSTVFGDSFGSNTLAVAVWRYDTSAPSVTTEADVIFNNQQKYDSYRGPLQNASGSSARVYDLRRVALHEFGHVLGLDHPDEGGQPGVTALMNSQITDLDHLADDDIAGARALYDFEFTSPLWATPASVGSHFSYFLTASRSGATFSATGLPDGLRINGATGEISGTPVVAGTFDVPVSATIGVAKAQGIFRIVVSPPTIYAPLRLVITVGTPLNYRIRATNSPTAFTASELPPGLQLDASSGYISGTPTKTGTFAVTLTASGAGGEASAVLTIIVRPPQITSLRSVSTDVGVRFRYQIAATNNPTSFEASGLPAGLRLDTATGLISGKPTVAGEFVVTATAFGAPAKASAKLRITVNPPRITSVLYLPEVAIGGAVTYQITATHAASSYTVTGLPSGLTFNPQTGVISGVATLTGTFKVTVTAHTVYGAATAVLQLIIPPPGSPEVKVYPTAMVADIPRARLYVADRDRGLFVFNSKSLALIRHIPNREFTPDLAISADGRKLWAPNFVYSRLASIDLETFEVSPGMDFGHGGYEQVREGLGGRLYMCKSGTIEQFDPATGAITSFSPGRFGGPARIEISPDRKTLYAASRTELPSVLVRYDISTPVPTLIESVTQSGYGDTIAVSHNGHLVALTTRSYSDHPGQTTIRNAGALTQVRGLLHPPGAVTTLRVAFSTDDTLVFQSAPDGGAVDVFETANFTRVRQILLPDNYRPWRMAVDSTDSYFFEGGGDVALTAHVLKPLPPEPAAPAPAHTLLNVSTRARSGAGEDALTAGFIITGNLPKKILLRAVGPSLPMTSRMKDTYLTLHDASGAPIFSNDNWNYTRADVLATGAPPTNERESAIVATLQPGSYTARLTGVVANSSGVAVVEVYDLDSQQSRLVNLSTRAAVGSGENVMIGGFILGGDQPTQIMVRAIGPSLSSSGVARPLADTTLALHDGNGALVAQNDDWRSDQAAAIVATGVPPADARESAIVQTLMPGNYTAIVRGKDNTTGIGLVEVYNLDAK